MPRHKGDHDARRRDVSAAVWRVLVARGFGGLTLRAVATEMGATTGLITHYFPSKKDLLAHALTVLDEHRATRPRRTAPECPAPPEGLPALRAALMETLPLTREAVADSRIWVSSWDAALADPSLTSGHGARYARSRERIRHHVRAAQLRGELPVSDPDETAAVVQSFVLGLVVQALFSAEELPAARQVRLLDGFLATLASAAGGP